MSNVKTRRSTIFGPLLIGEKYLQRRTTQTFFRRNAIMVKRYRNRGFRLEVFGFTRFLIRYDDSMENLDR